MQSSTGQYSTHAGDPAQPVQHSVITASSFGFFFRGVVSPLDRGSCFRSAGTIAAGRTASVSLAMAGIILSIWQFCIQGSHGGSTRPVLYPSCPPDFRPAPGKI